MTLTAKDPRRPFGRLITAMVTPFRSDGSLDADGAAEAVSAYGDRGLAVAGDVTSEDAVATAFAQAVEAFGGVDIVVSNAGIASSAFALPHASRIAFCCFGA